MALERLEPGFDMDNVLTAVVTLPEAHASRRGRAMDRRAPSRGRGSCPASSAPAPTSRLPFAGGRWNPNRGLEIEGPAAPRRAKARGPSTTSSRPACSKRCACGSSRAALSPTRDGAGAPLVAIVNQAMARRFWPDRSPLGARLRQGDDPAGQWRTVVGVVADIRNDDADQPPLPYLYVPLAQQPRTDDVADAAHGVGDPAALAEPLRRAIAALRSGSGALRRAHDARGVGADLSGSRMLIQVMGALALIALGLAGSASGAWRRSRSVSARARSACAWRSARRAGQVGA